MMSRFRKGLTGVSGRSLTIAAGMVTALLVLLTATNGAGQGLEEELKAEFIERFTRFIEWPASTSVGDPSRPFVIGVVGDSTIRLPLGQMAEVKKIKGKRVQLSRYATAEDIGDCQVLFVSSSVRGQLGEILRRVEGKPVLTVGDTAGFGKSNVMINFYLEGDFVRFEINMAAVRRSGLKVADQLIALGKAVD